MNPWPWEIFRVFKGKHEDRTGRAGRKVSSKDTRDPQGLWRIRAKRGSFSRLTDGFVGGDPQVHSQFLC